MKRIVYLLLVVVVLAGCKSSKRLVTSETKAPVSSYLASKLQLTIPDKKGGSLSVGGTMRMKTHERVQISLLMPILRTEVARIEVTPEEVLLVDRMNRRFVRASKEEGYITQECGVLSFGEDTDRCVFTRWKDRTDRKGYRNFFVGKSKGATL